MKQFTVICRKEDYDEVAQILEGWGYRLFGEEWLDDEDCVVATSNGTYMTFESKYRSVQISLRYTLEELRAMENPNT